MSALFQEVLDYVAQSFESKLPDFPGTEVRHSGRSAFDDSLHFTLQRGGRRGPREDLCIHAEFVAACRWHESTLVDYIASLIRQAIARWRAFWAFRVATALFRQPRVRTIVVVERYEPRRPVRMAFGWGLR